VQQPKGRRALSIKCFMERAAEANTSSVVSLERSAVIKLALFEKHRPACLSLGLYGRALTQTADGAASPEQLRWNSNVPRTELGESVLYLQEQSDE
jgi:hypothetical protein